MIELCPSPNNGNYKYYNRLPLHKRNIICIPAGFYKETLKSHKMLATWNCLETTPAYLCKLVVCFIAVLSCLSWIALQLMIAGTQRLCGTPDSGLLIMDRYFFKKITFISLSLFSESGHTLEKVLLSEPKFIFDLVSYWIYVFFAFDNHTLEY